MLRQSLILGWLNFGGGIQVGARVGRPMFASKKRMSSPRKFEKNTGEI
jgi:hypothetical protein